MPIPPIEQTKSLFPFHQQLFVTEMRSIFLTIGMPLAAALFSGHKTALTSLFIFPTWGLRMIAGNESKKAKKVHFTLEPTTAEKIAEALAAAEKLQIGDNDGGSAFEELQETLESLGEDFAHFVPELETLMRNVEAADDEAKKLKADNELFTAYEPLIEKLNLLRSKAKAGTFHGERNKASQVLGLTGADVDHNAKRSKVKS